MASKALCETCHSPLFDEQNEQLLNKNDVRIPIRSVEGKCSICARRAMEEIESTQEQLATQRRKENCRKYSIRTAGIVAVFFVGFIAGKFS